MITRKRLLVACASVEALLVVLDLYLIVKEHRA